MTYYFLLYLGSHHIIWLVLCPEEHPASQLSHKDVETENVDRFQGCRLTFAPRTGHPNTVSF